MKNISLEYALIIVSQNIDIPIWRLCYCDNGEIIDSVSCKVLANYDILSQNLDIERNVYYA